MFSPYIIDTLQAEEVQIDLRSMAWSFYLRMISPFGPMMRVPGGTSFLTLFGGADSSHFSSSLPSGVRRYPQRLCTCHHSKSWPELPARAGPKSWTRRKSRMGWAALIVKLRREKGKAELRMRKYS